MNLSAVNFTLTLGLLLILANFVAGEEYGYGRKNGPDHWSENYQRCDGKHQSPINIDELTVKDKDFSEIQYLAFDSEPEKITATNNGHTVVVRLDYKGKEIPSILGGPLADDDIYKLEQLHFHWGENDTMGSEDLINNHSFPAELHVVMRNRDTKSFEDAMGQERGIAVMAFFFTVSTFENEDYNELIEMFEHLHVKDTTTEFKSSQSLQSFLTHSMENYYTYIGSLTTPPCSEDVIWIDFPTPISISEFQLERFRELTSGKEHLFNNFRPTQPLNDRTVYRPMRRLPAHLSPFASSIPFVDAENGVGGLRLSCLCLLAYACSVIHSYLRALAF